MRRRRRRVTPSAAQKAEEASFARYQWWALRIVGAFDLSRLLVKDEMATGREVRLLLGLPATNTDDEFDEKRADKLRRLHAQMLKLDAAALAALEERKPPSADAALFRNCRTLGAAIGLSAVEVEILAFLIEIRRVQGLRDLVGCFENIDFERFVGIISAACNLTYAEVFTAVRETGLLVRSGLMELNQRGISNRVLDDFYDLMLMAVKSLCSSEFSTQGFLDTIVTPLQAPTLTLEDFPHLAEEADLLGKVIGCALQQRHRAVNILLYGPPGTGKTEFVKALAATVDADLREVRTADESGESLSRVERARAYHLAQAALTERPRQILLFDEIEDLFPAGLFALFGERTGIGKGWVNRNLESNPVPTLWLSNQVQHMDPAYLRRFDLAVEFRIPPRTVRRKVFTKYLGDLDLTETWASAVVEHPGVSPALIQRAAKVAALTGRKDAPTAARLAVRGALEVLDLPPIQELELGPTAYDLGYINASCDLQSIVDGLVRTGEGRLCLYGLPGTGKTAFAKHIAIATGRPLLSKRASDLFSMWLGATEKNIAAMFKEARDEGAVLLLDEADSMLRDRTGAQQRWEFAQVNEMLTWMESFRGIFVCSTNLVDSLDAASLRRFDRKVEFRALTVPQRWAMYLSVLERAGVRPPTEGEAAWIRQQLAAMTNLTPGDFAAACRGRRLMGGVRDAVGLVEDLRQETAIRQRGSRPIGFVGGNA